MVTFVTLFLTLINGSHPVEVAVGGAVARVEIRLDQRTVEVLEAPPWRTSCDFGPYIEPHELEAVAYDEAGRELHRARQLVNVPRPPAETRIVLETDDEGEAEAFRVVWESAEPATPLSVFASIDGRPLRPDEAGRFVLPPLNLEQVHILSAEAKFVDGVSARSDVTIGGRYGSRVATELTAVPIVADRKPEIADVESALSIDGRPLAVVAMERPGSRIFFVRDQATLSYLTPLRRRQDQMLSYRVGRRPLMDPDLDRDDDQFYFVVPNPIYRRGRQLFPTSRAVDLDHFKLTWLTTHLSSDAASEWGQKLADAVAVAGVQAASEGCPRAVVLLLTGSSRDGSGQQPHAVRQYLRQLHVPLHVWTTNPEVAEEWGEPAQVVSLRSLQKAAKRVRRDLDRQWIVWVEGSHIASRIEIAENEAGLTLAGQ